MSAGRSQLGSSAGKMKKLMEYKKYTVQPTGFWARINRFLAVDPNRSTGIPLNPQYRNPPPGGLDPRTYDDPVTVPAADLAENPYWKRDIRRRYPRLATVTQADAVSLLTVGSKGHEKVELIGEAGKNALVEAKGQGEKGLAAFFQKDKSAVLSVLGEGGMPPLPSGLHEGKQASKSYELLKEQSYGTNYPCRTFE
ncbi:NADH dehydrogenase 29/21K chain precursor [Saccharata proteae CBS 121410]|uniref:NADH dehydrogenase 29/21K chain n=1 Tax=Saccharata proteae CBS 121410 TaxID=1314787 RepID=A0A9P4LVZ8_9PEZI|nr:NADH dehydrogenase 29/21K chain precursor [Saccharata proteae CBS 121410]